MFRPPEAAIREAPKGHILKPLEGRRKQHCLCLGQNLDSRGCRSVSEPSKVVGDAVEPLEGCTDIFSASRGGHP